MVTKYVYLGRFAPFHLGHKRLLEKMIKRWGENSVLILIGSTNSVTKRTPYTYMSRKKIIKTIFPKIEILPLPDGKPNSEYFDGSTNDIWLDSIEKIASRRGEKFVFCGGSVEDLEVPSWRFETIVVTDRYKGKVFSATEVRRAINTGDIKSLSKMVDDSTLQIITSEIKKL